MLPVAEQQVRRRASLIALLIVLAWLSVVTVPLDVISGHYPHCDNPDNSLPNVLLLGDSTQMAYYRGVREALKGQANVFRVVTLAPKPLYRLAVDGFAVKPVNGKSTRAGMLHLDDWLGTQSWDLIHFNWGIHDLHRSRYGDFHGLTQEQAARAYGENLEGLMQRLTATRARLIFATTTHVPLQLGYLPGEVEAFNRQAALLAREEGIAINDLYSATRDRLPELQIANDVHFNSEGDRILAEFTARRIMEELGRNNTGEDASQSPAHSR